MRSSSPKGVFTSSAASALISNRRIAVNWKDSIIDIDGSRCQADMKIDDAARCAVATDDGTKGAIHAKRTEKVRVSRLGTGCERLAGEPEDAMIARSKSYKRRSKPDEQARASLRAACKRSHAARESCYLARCWLRLRCQQLTRLTAPTTDSPRAKLQLPALLSSPRPAPHALCTPHPRLVHTPRLHPASLGRRRRRRMRRKLLRR